MGEIIYLKLIVPKLVTKIVISSPLIFSDSKSAKKLWFFYTPNDLISWEKNSGINEVATKL